MHQQRLPHLLQVGGWGEGRGEKGREETAPSSTGGGEGRDVGGRREGGGLPHLLQVEGREGKEGEGGRREGGELPHLLQVGKGGWGGRGEKGRGGDGKERGRAGTAPSSTAGRGEGPAQVSVKWGPGVGEEGEKRGQGSGQGTAPSSTGHEKGREGEKGMRISLQVGGRGGGGRKKGHNTKSPRLVLLGLPASKCRLNVSHASPPPTFLP